QLVADVREYAIFLLDPHGNVATWNAGAERIKGYRAEEIIGQHFSRFYAIDAMAAGRPAHALNVAATAGRFEDEGWRVRKDGSRFYPTEAVEAGEPERELDVGATAGKYEEEGWRVRKDGSRFWASVVLTALRDEGGTLQGFAKVTRDQTERKQAEEKARRLLQEEAARQAAEASAREAQRAQREERHHREQLHVTLSSIGDAVIVTDLNGNVTFLNP